VFETMQFLLHFLGFTYDRFSCRLVFILYRFKSFAIFNITLTLLKYDTFWSLEFCFKCRWVAFLSLNLGHSGVMVIRGRSGKTHWVLWECCLQSSDELNRGGVNWSLGKAKTLHLSIASDYFLALNENASQAFHFRTRYKSKLKLIPEIRLILMVLSFLLLVLVHSKISK